jgi:hypothetical protein
VALHILPGVVQGVRWEIPHLSLQNQRRGVNSSSSLAPLQPKFLILSNPSKNLEPLTKLKISALLVICKSSEALEESKIIEQTKMLEKHLK